ncbi:hypothetical protein QBC46DRAFT_263165, partial [Diplogelasinospora grovesii]
NAPPRRTCGYCHLVCRSRNALFKHLGTCESALAGVVQGAGVTTEPQEEPVAQVVEEPGKPGKAESSYKIQEAPAIEAANPDSNPLSSYSHLRVKAKASPEAQEVEVCLDPGTGRTLIGRSFLEQLDHSIVPKVGKVKGVGNKSLSLKEWATFSFYLPGRDRKGANVLTKFTKQGWVVDDLAPNLLLGNDFLKPYGMNIDYEDNVVSFAKVKGFQVDIQVENRAPACVRKVTSLRKVTLLPGQEVQVPVHYKPLPNDRSFSFTARHPAALNAIVDARTPKDKDKEKV